MEVKDVRQTVRFYESVLNFSLVMAVPQSQDGVHTSLVEDLEYVYALMKSGDAELMFQRSDSFRHDIKLVSDAAIGATVSFYMEVEDLPELYQQIIDKVTAFSPIKTTWYGMNEFYVNDCNGYILGFAEPSTEIK